MATEKDDERKKLQITERLQKREEERLQNIQQRKIVKEDGSTIHVCGLECYWCRTRGPVDACSVWVVIDNLLKTAES